MIILTLARVKKMEAFNVKKLTVVLSSLIIMTTFGVNSVSANEINDEEMSNSDVVNQSDIQEAMDAFNNERESSLENLNNNGLTENNGGFSIMAAKNLTRRYTDKRGGAPAWTKTTIDWTYNGSRVLTSDATQSVGWIFPNIVRAKGVTKLSTSTNTTHKYRSTSTYGAGTPTPWGDVKAFETTAVDYNDVRSNGTAKSY